MDIEEIRSYCLGKPGVTEGYPFGETTLVFKVVDRMFLLAGLDEVPLSINIKAEPETAIEQRERYPAVLPGYHMNKKHWNTVLVDGSIRPSMLRQWIDDSYALVSQSLTAAKRKQLG